MLIHLLLAAVAVLLATNLVTVALLVSKRGELRSMSSRFQRYISLMERKRLKWAVHQVLHYRTRTTAVGGPA